jgi:hypothetical protein
MQVSSLMQSLGLQIQELWVRILPNLPKGNKMRISVFICSCVILIYCGSVIYPPHGGLFTGLFLAIFLNLPIGEKILDKLL